MTAATAVPARWLALALFATAPAGAVSFNLGEIEGQFDSSLSIGANWSMTHRDRALIGAANGGTGYSQTGDDGRLNFRKGETFSQIFKGIHDLELRYRDSGAFIRGRYWYDFELKDQSRPHKDISDSNRTPAARSSAAQILDAFVYHNHALGTLRLGRQVVNWGESSFIGNGINAINPIDASALRRPGAQLSEGLLPVNLLYLSQSLSDRLSLEVFQQLEWRPDVVENCGTFFASSDVLADGCDEHFHVLRSFNAAEQALFASLGVTAGAEGLRVPRGDDREARDSGQFGLALRGFGDHAEYAGYVLNYHSRSAFIGMQNADPAGVGAAGTALAALGAQGMQATLLGRGRYHLDYPEDIRLYGASFSTTLTTGTRWAGEISYRPNAPLQINTADLTAGLALGIGDALLAGDPAGAAAQAGRKQRGYQRKEVTQIQTTLTHVFDRMLGAQRLTLIGEAGFVHVGGLPSRQALRFGRDAVFGSPLGSFDDSAQVYGWKGFVTANAWGYRLRARADYEDVLGAVTLTPNLAFSHDVDGYGPNGIFNEGARAVSIGLDAEYRSSYTASLSYTDFFGGDFNTQVDRDFLAFSVGVSF